MALARVVTWSSGNVLTASDLNGEFNNILDNALSLISPLTGNLNANNKQITDAITIYTVRAFTASDATPDVSGGCVFRTANALATTITAFDGGTEGQIIYVIINDANTTIDFTGTTLSGNAGVDWSPTTNDHLEAVNYNGRWYCRISDNTA